MLNICSQFYAAIKQAKFTRFKFKCHSMVTMLVAFYAQNPSA